MSQPAAARRGAAAGLGSACTMWFHLRRHRSPKQEWPSPFETDVQGGVYSRRRPRHSRSRQKPANRPLPQATRFPRSATVNFQALPDSSVSPFAADPIDSDLKVSNGTRVPMPAGTGCGCARTLGRPAGVLRWWVAGGAGADADSWREWRLLGFQSRFGQQLPQRFGPARAALRAGNHAVAVDQNVERKSVRREQGGEVGISVATILQARGEPSR